MTGVPARAVWQFDAIGTRWEIESSAPIPARTRVDVERVIEDFDRAWSRFRPDSLVSALAAGAFSVPAPPDTQDMLAAYAALADASGGAVNPLIGQSLARRGYDAAYSFVDTGPQAAPAHWQTLLTENEGMLTLRDPAMLDVGALGKGRLVDLVLDVVAADVAGDLVVDASGDLAARGAPVRIGLEHPYDPRRAIGAIEVADAALCASATNRRAWGDGLHHVLDARTGMPVHTIAATWAVGPTAMRADAIATALFFDGGPELAQEWGIEWVRMTTDGRVEWSPGSRAELYS